MTFSTEKNQHKRLARIGRTGDANEPEIKLIYSFILRPDCLAQFVRRFSARTLKIIA